MCTIRSKWLVMITVALLSVLVLRPAAGQVITGNLENLESLNLPPEIRALVNSRGAKAIRADAIREAARLPLGTGQVIKGDFENLDSLNLPSYARTLINSRGVKAIRASVDGAEARMPKLVYPVIVPPNKVVELHVHFDCDWENSLSVYDPTGTRVANFHSHGLEGRPSEGVFKSPRRPDWSVYWLMEAHKIGPPDDPADPWHYSALIAYEQVGVMNVVWEDGGGGHFDDCYVVLKETK